MFVKQLSKGGSPFSQFIAVSLIVLLCLQFLVPPAHAQQMQSEKKSTVTVFATGLTNPRGLKFGPVNSAIL